VYLPEITALAEQHMPDTPKWASSSRALSGAVIGMQYVPVDTIICFRASIPLVVAIIEYIFLGRELPTLRSWISLSGTASSLLLFVVLLVESLAVP
jgi:hypothetical protein